MVELSQYQASGGSSPSCTSSSPPRPWRPPPGGQRTARPCRSSRPWPGRCWRSQCALSAERNWSVYGKIKTAESSHAWATRSLTSAKASTATRRCTSRRSCSPPATRRRRLGHQRGLRRVRDRGRPGCIVQQASARDPPQSRIHCVEGRSEYARAYSAPK